MSTPTSSSLATDETAVGTQSSVGGPRPGGAAAEPDLPAVAPSAYVALDEVGRGGLGRIMRARDTRTGRIVAIKEMRVDSADAAARFVREAIVTANLQHPSIVPVYEVGRWDGGALAGRPFYAMKLVTGRPLSQVIAGAGDLDRRLALLPHIIAVADALAYAHGERVIHRDLKPANVMIGAHGETVVIDWGLARRLDGAGDSDVLPPIGDAAPGETVVGSVLGTPQFMAPEQAHGERADERADVYAIGALLYHLLVGRPPFDGLGSASAVIEAVRTREPAPAESLAPAAPRDLIAIARRAMAREPAARYATAAALADDLRRFATGQLVSAHRYSRAERVRRFGRRYRAVLAIGGVALAALLVTGTVSVRRVMREREAARTAERGQRLARAEAEQQRAEAQEQLAGSLVERARNELQLRQPGRAAVLLAEAMRLSPERDDLLVLADRAATSLPALHSLWPSEVTGVVFAPGGDVVLSHARGVDRRAVDGTASRWSVALSPVTELLLVGDEVLALTDTGIVVLALDSGRELRRFGAMTPPVNDVLSAELGGGGRWIALKGPSGEVEVWEVATGRLGGRMSTGLPRGYAVPSPDGRRVAVTASTPDGTGAYLYDVASGRRLVELCPASQACGGIDPAAGSAVVLIRDGRYPGGQASVFSWDGTRRFTIELPHTMYDAALSERHGLVLVLAADGTLQAHDLASGRRRWSSRGLVQGYGLTLDEAAGRVWAYGRDGGVSLYDLATGAELGWWWMPRVPIGLAASDAGVIATIDEKLAGHWWRPDDNGVRILAPTPERVWRVAWLDDERIVTGSNDGSLAIHAAASGAVVMRADRHDARISEIVVLGGGRIVTAARDQRVIMWDAARAEPMWTLAGGGIRVQASPDERELVTATAAGEVARVDAADPAKRTVLGSVPRDPMAVRWSPDGRWIAAIDEGGTVVVWRASDGAEVRRLAGRPPPGSGGVDVAFSPDGRWLFASRAGPRVLVALDGGQDLTLEDSDDTINWAAAFSPDGARVASNDESGDIQVWSTRTGKVELRLGAPAMSPAMRFSPDGKVLVAGGIDHVVRVWDLGRGALLSTYDAVDEVYSLEWSPDGERLALTTLAAAATWRPRRKRVDQTELRRSPE